MANIQAGTVSAYRTNDNALIATIPVGNAFDVDVTPDGQHVWVASFGGPIAVIRTSDNTVVATGTTPLSTGTWYRIGVKSSGGTSARSIATSPLSAA